MNRDQFFLVLDKVARVLAEEHQVVIFGSQALHPWVFELPDVALRSKEVDVAPIQDPDDKKQSRINWVMGEDSAFDLEYAVYAEGVSIDLFTAPTGWLQRAKRLQIERADGTMLEVLCPEPHDICIGKLIADREKDEAFVEALAREAVIDLDGISHLLTDTDATPDALRRASETVDRIRLRVQPTSGAT